MIKRGSLIATETSLASAISQLEIRGVLDIAGSVAPDDPGMVSLSKGAVLDITPALRLRVEASAAIVDDGWTEELEPLGDSERYDAFRRFHSTLGNFRLLVEGVSRGFAVEREFEQTLWQTVNDELKKIRASRFRRCDYPAWAVGHRKEHRARTADSKDPSRTAPARWWSRRIGYRIPRTSKHFAWRPNAWERKRRS